MPKPRVLSDSYPSVVTLPLEVQAMICANGETIEWSLLYGGRIIETIWLTGVTEEVAVKQLLAKTVNFNNG